MYNYLSVNIQKNGLTILTNRQTLGEGIKNHKQNTINKLHKSVLLLTFTNS